MDIRLGHLFLRSIRYEQACETSKKLIYNIGDLVARKLDKRCCKKSDKHGNLHTFDLERNLKPTLSIQGYPALHSNPQGALSTFNKCFTKVGQSSAARWVWAVIAKLLLPR